MSTSNNPKPDLEDALSANNLNKHWKNLDAIFQASLRKYVLTNDKEKFNAMSKELGFNEIQSNFLFESIHTFTMQCMSPNASLSPFPNQYPLYAIPNNKNECIHRGLKRRRSDIDSSDFDESSDDDTTAPKTKKKKTDKDHARENSNESDYHFDDLWQTDTHLSKKKQNELEDDGVYVVEDIVNHKQIGNKKYKYNVKWVGYNDATWEPLEHLNPFMVDDYWRNKGMLSDRNAAVVYLNQRKQKIEKKKGQETEKKKKKKTKKKKRKNVSVQKEYKCFECDKVFKNGWALGGHNASKHKKKKENKKDGKVYWEDSDGDGDKDLLIVNE